MSKAQEIENESINNLTTTIGPSGDTTINMTASRTLLTELESKMGEFEQLKEKEQQQTNLKAIQDQDEPDTLTGDGQNVEPAEKGCVLNSYLVKKNIKKSKSSRPKNNKN
jgi:hypothetical protein